jgi:hypothetical protein
LPSTPLKFIASDTVAEDPFVAQLKLSVEKKKEEREKRLQALRQQLAERYFSPPLIHSMFD